MSRIFKNRRSSGVHTPLFNVLRRAMRAAHASNQPGAPPVDEMSAMIREPRAQGPEWSRRQFIKTAGAGGLFLSASAFLAACAKTDSNPIVPKNGPRIVIVGGGIAGLNAAYQLKKKGRTSQIYDANTRTGGRMYTAHDLLAPGVSTELGGEFIDSTHADLLGLAAELGLSLYDTHGPSESSLIREGYFIGGRNYSEAEVIAAFQPLTARLAADAQKLDDATLDKTSLAQYLHDIGATGWLYDMLNVAYLTEYGLDTDQQSCLNLVSLITTDVSGGEFDIFGASDERYKIQGGNQQIVDGLAAALSGQINLQHQLEAVKPNGTGYTLTFQKPGGAVDVVADIVVMALPFTMLRNVEMSTVPLPDVKKQAIAELGYGTNVKLMAGFTSRLWRAQGYTGYVFTDAGFQTGWDSSQMQPGSQGGYTMYLGGTRAVNVGAGDAAAQAAILMNSVETVFPGAKAALNGNVAKFDWPSYQWTKGSYACYKVGQWTTIGGEEAATVGNMYFAGEHCSEDFQGFMNGGAETGRIAAEAIAAAIA